MNILITSSSAKVLLVKEFNEYADREGIKVFTADISKNIATAFFSDKHFVLPRTSDKDAFLEQLRLICRSNNISLIIPTRDGELQLMADHKEQFAALGTKILVPSPESTRICLNKREFANFLVKYGYSPIPETDVMDFPLFVRPVTGSAGIGTCRVLNENQLNDIMSGGDFLVHPFIDADEYSLDLLMDFDGNALQVVCRKRIHVVSGESKVSRVISMPVLEQWAMEIGELLGLVGHNVLQAFHSDETGPLIIEANARFGGASNLSIAAGLDSVRRIIGMHIGDPVALANRQIEIGLTMYRYSKDIFAHEA